MKAILLLSAWLCAALSFAAEPIKIGPNDWPWWRGPTRDGVAAAGQQVPFEWGESKNVLWKTPLNGKGHGSPTVVGGQVFLAAGDEGKGTQSIIALDAKTGRKNWEHVVNQGGLPAKIHKKNTHASGTIASDGHRVFAIYYNQDAIHVVARGLDGSEQWEQRVGPFKPKKYEFGYGGSPLVYKDWVIVTADYEEGGFLAALNRATGKVDWRTERIKGINYVSPVVYTVAGREQLLLAGCHHMFSYDPMTGKELWRKKAGAGANCGTVVVDGDLAFSSGGYPESLTIAVKADGSGELVWQNKQKSYEQSMLVHEGHLYALTDKGIAYCWRTKDGKEMWSERLSGPVSISPVLVGDTIIAADERGSYYVFKADPSAYTPVAQNRLGNHSFATPTVCGNRIYIRAGQRGGGVVQESLYCIGR